MIPVQKYLSLIKFSHTIFALPFALIGFFLGMQTDVITDTHTLLKLFLLVLGCMVFARSAAMAFNRYLDRQIDALNPRTAVREIPAGAIRPSQALAFTILSAVLFIVCTWFINRICFYLSPIALFVILFYSYTKRFTPLCHLVLGLGLSLAPIGAYLAVTGSFHLLPVLFSLAVLFWVSGFDIIYALQDESFDRTQQLHSIPVWLGASNALLLSRCLHALSALCILAAYWVGHFGGWYLVGFMVFAGMLIYQQSIVSPRNLSRVNLAFMTANGIASVVFAVFVITDLYFKL
ncbi:MAG TPA: 4-hydroxybenzoate octaprenyltransferase [Chitinophagaceae bacterium]|nr:4-hydroxybenzoate octaprenyltransferase [Chitinophagaceae bacterium]HML56984.1 UbiA-like polyprenyltransferase [Ferruginibacter sp.]